MNYKAFYRTYRPSTFEQVVGQDHIVKTLVNLIKMKKISHGYLFSGPRGTGKTSVAKIFANAINCIHSEHPEQICKKCLENSSRTLDIIEIDAASNNSVNDVRTIREQIEFAPTNSPYKIYIIDEVHMLTQAAFNALLMTLEEPPAHAIFILATTNPDKIPDTILSRVQRYNFKRITKTILESQLEFIFQKENITYDKESVEMIAKLANGSLRDALSISDQINAYSNSNITIDRLIEIFGLSTVDSQIHFINLLANKLVSEALQFFDSIANNGIDISRFIVSILDVLKDFLVFKHTQNQSLVSTNIQFLNEILLKDEGVYEILDILSPLINEIKNSDIPQQLFQLAIIRICSIEATLVDVSKNVQIDNTIFKTSQNSQKPLKEKNIAHQPTNTMQIDSTTKTHFDDDNSSTYFVQTTQQNLKSQTVTKEYSDITSEYFGSTATTEIKNENELNANNKENNIQTKTILADFSNTDIQNKIGNLMDDFSLEKELEKSKSNQLKENTHSTELNQESKSKSLDFQDGNSFEETQVDQTLTSNDSFSFVTNHTSTENLINDTTELLNISNEQDGSDREVNETLLNSYQTNKQTFDTNEISVLEETSSKEIIKPEPTVQEEVTKEFVVNSEDPTTSFTIKDLTQPQIVNLFLLSKKDTHEIFKSKLESACVSDIEEFESFTFLLKEAKFICSANDFILVSSNENWVVGDINKKTNDPIFKKYVAKYFGNNVHFYAITKDEYIISKQLYIELEKTHRVPEPKPLSPIQNVSEDNEYNKNVETVETKTKAIFGNLFSKKKE